MDGRYCFSPYCVGRRPSIVLTRASVERKVHVQTVDIYLGIIIHTVQTVDVYLGIIIHTCQRGKEGSRADCARIFRDYYSHVPAWKGRVTCRLCTYM
jgi:hypothetical protein